MKKLLILLTIILAGCASTEVPKVQVVTVDKPIPFCPTPPTERDKLATLPLQVNKLNDKSSDGDVAQAYKYDMELLRQLKKIDDMILEAYKNNSTNLDAIKGEIDKTYTNLTQKLKQSDAEAAKPVVVPTPAPDSSVTSDIKSEVKDAATAVKEKALKSLIP